MIEKIINVIIDWSPILLSVVAIYISIITVQMQKKMDLFDKRYDVYYQIEKIISYKNSIKFIDVPPVKTNEGENFDLANVYLALWRSQDIEFDEKLNINDIKNSFDIANKISTINKRKESEIKELNKVELLYFLEDEKNIIIKSFINCYKEFIEGLTVGVFKLAEVNIKDKKEKFVRACDDVEENLLKEMKNVINVNNIF